MTPIDVAGLVRRIRRTTDLSQRELAAACGVAPAVVAKAETGTRDLPVVLLARMTALAGLRLVVLDQAGAAVQPMSGDGVRDNACRRLPAHLDTRHGDEDWWGGPHRPRLQPPRYTYDLARDRRDRRRQGSTPDDHHVPVPGDSLPERRAARLEQAHRRHQAHREAAWRARRAAGSPRPPDWGTGCTCPAGCEYAEERNEDGTHTPECACRCDVA